MIEVEDQCEDQNDCHGSDRTDKDGDQNRFDILLHPLDFHIKRNCQGYGGRCEQIAQILSAVAVGCVINPEHQQEDHCEGDGNQQGIDQAAFEFRLEPHAEIIEDQRNHNTDGGAGSEELVHAFSPFFLSFE